MLRREHPLDRFANLAANGRVLRGQIKLWDEAEGGGQWIRAHAKNDPSRGGMRVNSRANEALLFRKLRANGDGIVWIDGAGLFFDGLDDAFLVDNKRSALRPIIFFFLDVVHFQNTVFLEDFAIHVAKQRERDTDFLRKSVVGGGTIDANSQDDRV